MELPNIICPEDQSVEIQDKSMVTVVWNEPQAIDNSGNVTVIGCDKQSGANHTIGLIKVTCIAIDGSGNAATCGFKITINGKHKRSFKDE